MRTYRVTIRGRFVELPEPARSRLRAEAEGRQALRTWGEGHGVAVMADRVDVTCLDDIKVHRPTTRGSGRG